jgi:hypothetical protein
VFYPSGDEINGEQICHKFGVTEHKVNAIILVFSDCSE